MDGNHHRMSAKSSQIGKRIAYAAQVTTNPYDQSPPPPSGDGMSMSFGVPSEPGGSGDPTMRLHAQGIEMQASPFRIVVLDAFCGDATPSDRPAPVTAATIDDAMSSASVRVAIEVPNHLASKPKELTAELRFASLRDFRPKMLIEQVAELRAVRDLHRRLTNLRTGKITAAQLESELETVSGLDALSEALQLALQKSVNEPPPKPTPPAEADEQAREGRKLLDELLDMATPSEPTPSPPKPKGSAMDAVFGSIGGNKNANASNVARAMEIVADLLAAQLQEVVRAKPVRTLESAWRGLHFLATHASGAEGRPVRVEFLHADRDSLAERFAACVHAPDCAGETEHALSLTVTGCYIENNAAQLQKLRDTQQLAEELQAPILWPMHATFFGMTATQLAERDSVRSVLESPELAKWRGLRRDDAARWSGACFNRFLLRDAHDGKVDDWSFAERITSSDDLLWGAPSLFVAAVIARSVAENGWPTQFTGLRAGSIEGRPIANGLPIEGALSEATVEAFAENGILSLTCVRGRDSILLLRAPSAHEAAQYGNRDEDNDESRKMCSLPFQMLASRIAETTLRHKSTITTGDDPEAIRQRMQTFLLALVGDTGAGAAAAVTIETDAKDRDTKWLHCSVTTGANVLGGAEVQFSLRA